MTDANGTLQAQDTTRGPIDVPDHAQVVVIGGGVIGTSIAYHLTKLGWRDVVLLERRQLTSGTTWHAAGLITSAGMAHETLLWMARYTRELCISLEQETGQATGWRPIGHLHVANNPQRLEGLRREAAFARLHGVDNQELSPSEFGKLWPAARTDDVLAAFYVADEGRVNPADLTMAYARGARMGGARIFEHLAATGVTSERGRVTGVVTDHGTIRTDVVVNAAGMWARELGGRSGVAVPLQAAEHYYLITDTVDWAHPDLPVVEEPDRYGYYREEGGGILVGLFEPTAAPWSLDGVPDEIAFASLPPDWDRIGPFLTRAMDRFPSLHDARVRTMFCGPESFTADNMPQLGESPELKGYFVAAGMNSLGIILSGGVGSLMAQWIVDGAPQADVTGMALDRTQTYETTRRFRAERTVELLGDLFGDVAFPNAHPHTARYIRRSVIHDRLAAAGAHFAPSSLWEYAEWFAEPGTQPQIVKGWGRDASFPLQAAEHHAVRDAVGMLDMSLMAKFLVQGRDAERVLNLVSANDVAVPVGRIVYTPWLNAAGGIEADLTVTRLAEDRFLVVVTDLIHRRIAPWIERHVPDGAHVTVTDVTSGTTLLTVQGPRSRQLLSRLTSADLSNAAFPYLTAREIDLGYAQLLAMRVTYVGELGWELHVPAELALTVYDALMEAGQDLGYRNVGMGALGSLRLEKAYRDYALDIDNSDTPLDVGLGFTLAWDKPGGFIGRDALLAARTPGPPVRRLVQVLVEDAEPVLYGGEPVLLHGRPAGHVRAGAYGHTLGGGVGLAMIEDPAGLPVEAVEHGHIEIDIAGVRYPARASVRPMYDPDRHRIKA